MFREADRRAIAAGVAEGVALIAPPGRYGLILETDPPLRKEDVEIRPGEETRREMGVTR